MGIYFDLKYFQQLQTEFPSVEFDAEEKEPKLYVSADELLPLMHRLKENSIWAFDRMANITAVDYKEYIEMDGTTEDKQWVANFYNRFIVPLPDDTLLTIYEAKGLN